MPLKDKGAQLAYQREWYAKNSERVIKKVRKRKWHEYGGTCKFCGRPTMGASKGLAPDFCGRPKCRSAHNKEIAEVFSIAGRKGWENTKYANRKKVRNKRIVSIDELASGY
jgi:hypothetical protein